MSEMILQRGKSEQQMTNQRLSEAVSSPFLKSSQLDLGTFSIFINGELPNLFP